MVDPTQLVESLRQGILGALPPDSPFAVIAETYAEKNPPVISIRFTGAEYESHQPNNSPSSGYISATIATAHISVAVSTRRNTIADIVGLDQMLISVCDSITEGRERWRLVGSEDFGQQEEAEHPPFTIEFEIEVQIGA